MTSLDFDALVGLLAAATAATGLLAGLSVFRSLVELPAWRKINLSGFYEYARAADLGRGLFLYPLIGVAAALFVVLATIDGYFENVNSNAMILLYASLLLAVAHSMTTSRAAPNMLRLRSAPRNADTVRLIFERFKKWQDRRAVLQFLNFITLLLAMATLIA